jgi:hypothetical protein
MELKLKIRFCTPNPRVSVLTVLPNQTPFRIWGEGGMQESEKLQMMNDPIFRGTCEMDSVLFFPPVEAVVELANCREDEEGVQRFTRRYGALRTEDDRTFDITLGEWCAMRDSFRYTWDGFLNLESRYPREMIPYMKEHHPESFHKPTTRVKAPGYFEITSDGLIFFTDSLYDALVLVLSAIHEKRLLRHCPNPHCENPYFIAAHPRQRLCTELCSEWAQANAKSAWWKEKGKEWLKLRSKAGNAKSNPKKGSKRNVSQKTR